MLGLFAAGLFFDDPGGRHGADALAGQAADFFLLIEFRTFPHTHLLPGHNYEERRRSRSALNSQPYSAIADNRYIQISNAITAPILPYTTL